MNETRSIPLELRAEATGRRLAGTVMRYGDQSLTHRERFEPGAFRLADSVQMNLLHDRMVSIAWYPDGGLTLSDDENELRFEAELPPIPAADLALDFVRSGKAQGLSVEFRAQAEKRDQNGIRVISNALLAGFAIVPNPSYHQSKVEARQARNLDYLRLL